MPPTVCDKKNITLHVVELYKLDIDTQIRLFSNATAVIAQHGAGLVNTTWCSRCKLVVEYFSPPHVKWFDPWKGFVGKWVVVNHNEQFIYVNVENTLEILQNIFLDYKFTSNPQDL